MAGRSAARDPAYAGAVTRSERDRTREEAAYQAQEWTPSASLRVAKVSHGMH
jgi:hypothetical protein